MGKSLVYFAPTPKFTMLVIKRTSTTSKSGQIVFHTCYQDLYCIVNQDYVLAHILCTYNTDPKTTKLSRLKLSKFESKLILIWGIRKCHPFDPKLHKSAVANSFSPHIFFKYYMDPKRQTQADLSYFSFTID